MANANWSDPVSGKDDLFLLSLTCYLPLGDTHTPPSNFTSPALLILPPLHVNSCWVLTSFEGHAFTIASHSKPTSPWLKRTSMFPPKPGIAPGEHDLYGNQIQTPPSTVDHLELFHSSNRVTKKSNLMKGKTDLHSVSQLQYSLAV